MLRNQVQLNRFFELEGHFPTKLRSHYQKIEKQNILQFLMKS